MQGERVHYYSDGSEGAMREFRGRWAGEGGRRAARRREQWSEVRDRERAEV